MRAITTAKYSDPTAYELTEVPAPTVTDPHDIVFKVHAASINPVDVKLAAGAFKLAFKQDFPLKLGYDCSGIVTQVGSSVKKLKVGDEVWSRLPEANRGSWSEYAKSTEEHVALKPASLSFSDAASMPLAAMTALQALEKYSGSLEGKTVFIPAGLGGTGAFACQLAKNVFKAGKVITTVSTKKVPQVPELLGEGVVDEIVDYTKTDIKTAIPRGSVDFMFDTTGQAMQCLSLMRPKTSAIISVSTAPSGAQLQASSFAKLPDKPQIPLFPKLFLNASDALLKLRAKRWAVRYEYMFLEGSAAELDRITSYVEKGQLRPVVGTRAPFADVEKVRSACMQVYKAAGGIGKAVLEM